MSNERTVSINLHESATLTSNLNAMANGSSPSQLNLLPTSAAYSTGTTPIASPTGGASTSIGGGITIQNSSSSSNSFVITGTKANQACVSDGPVTDPGGSTTKQVIGNFSSLTHSFFVRE